MEKLNMTVGRFQPFTQGHLNMVNEGDGPCIIYQIKPAGIPTSLKGLKIGGRVIKKESVENVINFLNTHEGDLTEQEKELLKRPFTNELIAKELDIIRKNTHEIIDVVYVSNMFEAVAQFNKFILDNQDKYEAQYWMCGDDRLSDVNRIYDSYISTGKELSIKTDKYENVISNLKINTGKGRTEGVSGTAVRKSIINNDKSAFEKIMPKGTGVLFDEFIESYKAFKDKLRNLIKENQMMSLKEYIKIS
jgi:hypothetical protein